MTSNTKEQYWIGDAPKYCIVTGDPIKDVFYDAKTCYGLWAIMSEDSFAVYGGTNGKLGTGLGQKYCLQDDGSWLKVGG